MFRRKRKKTKFEEELEQLIEVEEEAEIPIIERRVKPGKIKRARKARLR